MDEDDTNVTEKSEAPKTRRGSIPRAEVEALVAGIGTFPKKAFTMVGHAQDRGTRLAVAATKKVGRVYFYGSYEELPSLPGISVFSEQERKDARLGGVVAEVDFSVEPAQYRAALAALIEVVRNAPVPEPRKVRPPKAPKDAQGESDPPELLEGVDNTGVEPTFSDA